MVTIVYTPAVYHNKLLILKHAVQVYNIKYIIIQLMTCKPMTKQVSCHHERAQLVDSHLFTMRTRQPCQYHICYFNICSQEIDCQLQATYC